MFFEAIYFVPSEEFLFLEAILGGAEPDAVDLGRGDDDAEARGDFGGGGCVVVGLVADRDCAGLADEDEGGDLDEDGDLELHTLDADRD